VAALFAFLHHVAAFTLVSALAVQLVLLRGELTTTRARQILGADISLGISAAVLLIVGLTRVFQLEKGAGYYFHSIPFIAKFSLFIIAGLISIYPTVPEVAARASARAGAGSGR
jgi:putative membrane protein